MEIVTLREFARRIDVSLTAVQKGVKSGRIVAQTDAKTGRITGIDYSTQAAAWEANCKAPQRRAHHQAGGRPRLDGQPVAVPKTAPKPPAARRPAGDAPPQPAGAMSLADIQRARELVKLQQDNIKLKEMQGDLVPAAEQRKQGSALASAVISGMYGIPDRVSDQLAGMTDDTEISKLLLSEIDKAVEQLRDRYAD